MLKFNQKKFRNTNFVTIIHNFHTIELAIDVLRESNTNLRLITKITSDCPLELNFVSVTNSKGRDHRIFQFDDHNGGLGRR